MNGDEALADERAFDELVAGLDARHPVALLPVRIETRFLPVGGRPRELAVRIYPDDIHLDSFERGLTDRERYYGQSFWEARWRARGDAGVERAAWQVLVEAFGEPRATWISSVLTPTNPAAAPAVAALPLDAEAPLDPAPDFPDAASRPAAWTRAARAAALPERFVVLGYKEGKQVLKQWGGPVRKVLAAGPAPDPAEGPTSRSTASESDQTELVIDDGIRWLVDLDEAVAAGMAMRIALPAAVEDGLDLLVVLGVRWSETPARGAMTLAGLLTTHAHTRGLEVLRQGTPTNNSTADRSGYASPDAESAAHSTPILDPLIGDGDGSDGARLARSLGIPAAALGRIRGGDRRSLEAAGDLNLVLWPSTFGYFLDQVMAPLLTPGDVDRAALHFAAHVLGRGPLPALRVGRQPYGVLPVTLADRFTASPDDFERGLADILGRMRPFFERAVATTVPRMGGDRDPNDDLTAVLGTTATTQSITARTVYGRQFLETLWANEDAGNAHHWRPVDAGASEGVARVVLASLGLSLDARVTKMLVSFHRVDSFALDLPFVTAGDLSEDAPVPTPRGATGNYLSAIADRLQTAGGIGLLLRSDHDGPLLYLLLNYGLLSRAADVAQSMGINVGATTARRTFEPELTDVETALTPTAARVLDAPVPQVTANVPVANFLGRPTAELAASDAVVGDRAFARAVSDTSGAPRAGWIEDATVAGSTLASQLSRAEAAGRVVAPGLLYLSARSALRRLAVVPSAELDRLLREHLDVCGHRLDAWYTSLATRRLSALRRQAPGGVYVGAYGWVEDLRSGPALAVVRPRVDDGDVYQDPNSGGFVHAPSTAHAATAAVLRSGNLTHVDVDAEVLSVDLSSARVRLALKLLDGVRQGQPLAALLGYRFERALHDGDLDRYVLPFRLLAPLVPDATAAAAGDQPNEAIAARNVVDGQRLWERWRAGDLPWGSAGLPASGSREQVAILAELARIDDAIDAVDDLLVAESVFQIVQGNPSRSSTALAAIDFGGGVPPESDIAVTPRSGTTVTHRLMALIAAGPAPAAGWSRTGSRAAAEPALDHWAGEAFGDPARVRIRAGFAGTSAVVEFALSDLDLSALDVLDGSAAADGHAASELEQRLLLHAARRRPAGVPEDAAVRLVAGRGPGWSPDVVGLVELETLVRAADRLLGAARSAAPRDVALPQHPSTVVASAADVKTRADAAAASLRTASQLLVDAIAAAAAPQPDWRRLTDALLGVADFAVPGAVPTTLGSDGVAGTALTEQAARVLAAVVERQRALDELERGFDRRTADAEAQIAHDCERLRRVFHNGFLVLAPFTPGNGGELTATFAAADVLRDGDSSAVETWLLRTGRVRDGAARLLTVLTGSELIGGQLRLDRLAVGQIAHVDGERWIGLPSPADGTVPAASVSLVATGADAVDFAGPITGLLIDEWTEVVPARAETTGVAFHYDQPGARAPQSILLAVPPPGADAWNLDTLAATVVESLELAKLRLVDAESLMYLGRVLPGLYVPDNLRRETLSIDFRHAVEVGADAVGRGVG
jgi:hypothetical protein